MKIDLKDYQKVIKNKSPETKDTFPGRREFNMKNLE